MLLITECGRRVKPDRDALFPHLVRGSATHLLRSSGRRDGEDSMTELRSIMLLTYRVREEGRTRPVMPFFLKQVSGSVSHSGDRVVSERDNKTTIAVVIQQYQ
jgi:hypothetical protein